MSAQTKKVRRRPSNKQSHRATRGSGAASLQKTVNVAVEMKTTGKRRGATRSVRGKQPPLHSFPHPRRPPSGSLRELSLKHAASLSAMPLCLHTPARRATRNLLRRETA